MLVESRADCNNLDENDNEDALVCEVFADRGDVALKQWRIMYMYMCM